MPKSLYRSAFSTGDVSPCDVLAFHHRIFGPSVMEADAGDDVAGDADENGNPTSADADDGVSQDMESASDDEETSKDDLKSRFEAQQKVNRDLERKFNQLRNGLKSALGVEDRKSASPEDLIAEFEKQLQVERVARRHNITDESDLAFLQSAKDSDAMEALAKRLAPATDDDSGTDKKKAGPRPDPSQGRGGAGNGARPTSVAQVMADRRAAREKASK